MRKSPLTSIKNLHLSFNFGMIVWKVSWMAVTSPTPTPPPTAPLLMSNAYTHACAQACKTHIFYLKWPRCWAVWNLGLWHQLDMIRYMLCYWAHVLLSSCHSWPSSDTGHSKPPHSPYSHAGTDHKPSFHLFQLCDCNHSHEAACVALRLTTGGGLYHNYTALSNLRWLFTIIRLWIVIKVSPQTGHFVGHYLYNHFNIHIITKLSSWYHSKVSFRCSVKHAREVPGHKGHKIETAKT